MRRLRMKLRIGLVGSGSTFSIGSYHALAIEESSKAHIVGIYNRTSDRSESFIFEHHLTHAKAYTSYGELLDAVDGIIICTPSNVHTSFIIEAIRKGVAILVEKPITSTYSECFSILDALEETPVFNMVGFSLRFSHNINVLKELIQNNIGLIYNLNITYGGLRLADPSIPFEWRMDKELSGYGSVQDFGSHLLDIASYVCNINIKEISCITKTHIPTRPIGTLQKSVVENDDSSIITALGERNELCCFHMSRVGFDEFKIVVNGEGGLIKNVVIR